MTYIPESEAMALMGFTNKKGFRHLIKKGKYPISYKKSPNGRVYQYLMTDIEKLQITFKTK